jgi:hypothetical protein
MTMMKIACVVVALAIPGTLAIMEDNSDNDAAVALALIVLFLFGFAFLFCCFRCIGWMCGCNRSQQVTIINSSPVVPYETF